MFAKANAKEIIKAPNHCPFLKESHRGAFPSQKGQ